MVQNEIIIAPKDQPIILYLILTNAMHLCSAFSKVISKGLTCLFIFSTDKHTHTHAYKKNPLKSPLFVCGHCPIAVFWRIGKYFTRFVTRLHDGFMFDSAVNTTLISGSSPTLRSKRDAPEKNQNRTLESRLQQTKANRELN